MSVKIWHNPRCSKSRTTLQLLHDQGIEPEVVLYLQAPPTARELKQVLGLLGIGPRELLRKGEAEYRDLGLSDPALSDAKLIEAMVAHPRLIERPVVVADGKAAVGRPPESVLDIL